MNFPFYRQLDSMDCGPTCLMMIARHYGKSISLQYLRERSQIGKEGVNMLGIGEAAESIGFRARPVQLTYLALTTGVTLPCILHWNQYHFVVLYKARRKQLFIADPAKGLVSLSREEFLSKWLGDYNADDPDPGVALLLEPTPKLFLQEEEEIVPRKSLGPIKSEGIAFRNIFNYILPYKRFVFQLFLGLLVAAILQLVLPFLTQSVVDVGINTANIHFIYIVLMAQAALVIGRLAVDFVRSWLLLYISTRINISILTDFLIKLMLLPVSFFDSKKTGDIMQRMNDHQRIETFLTGNSINVLFSSANLVIFSAVLAIFNPYIFTVFIAASLLYAIWVTLFLRKRKALDYRRFEVTAKEQSATIQLVFGMQDIKLNGVERPMRWTWERLQAKLFKLNMKGLALNQWQQSGASFINEGKNILITFIAAKAVIDGQMTLGTMLAVQYIMGQLNSPIEQMIGFIQSWQNAKISLDRLNEIHGMEDEEPADKALLQELPVAYSRLVAGGRDAAAPGMPEDLAERMPVHHPEPLPHLQPPEESITFSNVSFAYPGAGNTPVLRDIHLKIPKGRTTAIVGVSGSGKTTLLKLMLKFYEPQKGEIRLNDVPLSTISHKSWRSHCGAVMQESFIFSESIAYNIAVGLDKPDRKRLEYAAAIANIREFVASLPLGFSTKIGAEGMGISMGQKQRILIARAVYRDPDFIFFDEATNSLDANNESEIVHNLQPFLSGRTVVVVAHRLSTVRNADQIVVLNKGIIAEKGTHQELVNLKGEYYTLVKNQLELGE